MGVSSSRTGRGQSEVIGIVLLFSLVLVVSTTIVVVGSQSLNTAKADIEHESATATMTEMQSMVDQSEPEDPARQLVSFARASGGGDQRAATSSGHLERDGSVRIVKSDETDETGSVEIRAGGDTIEENLGRLVYEKDGRTVAYEGGAVIRQSAGGGSVMVSPPDFEYRYLRGEPSLAFGLVSITDTSSESITDDSFGIRQVGPAGGESIVNPIRSTETVTITVETPYHQAWAALFRDRTEDATVEIKDDDNDGMMEVKLVLDGSDTNRPGPVDSGVFAGAGTSLSNSGNIDSYKSSDGGHSGSFPDRKNGDISIAEDFVLNNNPDIYGDVRIGGDLDTSNNFLIDGETRVGGNVRTDNNPEFKGPFTVSGDLDMDADYLGDSSTPGEDPLVVGGELVALNTDAVHGSMYVHGPFMDNGRTFEVGTIHGSIHAAETVDLYGISGGSRNADIEGDILSNEDVHVGDGVTFVGSQGRIDAARDVEVFGSSTKNVDVVAGRDVRIHSGVDLDGDIHAAGDVYVDGDVSGEIVAGGQIHGDSDPSWTENGDPETPRSPTLPSADPPEIPYSYPADDEIDKMRGFDDDPDNNDNDANPGALAGIETNGGCTSTCTLGPGNYWVDRIDLSDGSEELEIDTNDEPVNIYVRSGDVDLTDATIDVNGDGRVKIAVDGGDVTLAKDLSVEIDDDRADQFWIFTMPSAAIHTSNNPEFTGVLYGADGSGGGTEFDLSNNPTIYGAMIGDVSTIDNNPDIHYDESLRAADPTGRDIEPGTRVGYVQVTTTKVEVTDD